MIYTGVDICFAIKSFELEASFFEFGSQLQTLSLRQRFAFETLKSWAYSLSKRDL